MAGERKQGSTARRTREIWNAHQALELRVAAIEDRLGSLAGGRPRRRRTSGLINFCSDCGGACADCGGACGDCGGACADCGGACDDCGGACDDCGGACDDCGGACDDCGGACEGFGMARRRPLRRGAAARYGGFGR